MEKMHHEASPDDSRYVPFTQQNYCCVPTSIQMIMYRNGLPLIAAEEIGYHLGLTVPPNLKHLFYAVRVADLPPSTAGFGTQIGRPEYNPNKAFAKLGVPLSFTSKGASQLASKEDLMAELSLVESNNSDALLCFNYGVLNGEYQINSGHVVVFDKIIDGQVRIVDASQLHPKWRFVDLDVLYDAIQQHGDENSGGIWFFNRTTDLL